MLPSGTVTGKLSHNAYTINCELKRKLSHTVRGRRAGVSCLVAVRARRAAATDVRTNPAPLYVVVEDPAATVRTVCVRCAATKELVTLNSEKGVRLAQKMQVGPCIPVVMQL